ncbi:MAG: TIGR03915 family putative DNA repair protein [Acetobacteraceae bacterium]|nr:TIGR03915 family putative DNA repair protein [Acetobacteraceae bacterium]
MFAVRLSRLDHLADFRPAARRLIAAGAPPEKVRWLEGEGVDLFGAAAPEHEAALRVPAGFAALAESVAQHRDRVRWALLYEALWRIAGGEPSLLEAVADPLVHRLRRMEAAVRRDAHRITAFLRFRAVADAAGERRFVAWYEPEHRILRPTAGFFVDRFAAMRWSILTPDGCLHWDTQALSTSAGLHPSAAPPADELEAWWQGYYRATFNPARASPALLRGHMPKKFWRNLPEAAEIEPLLAEAGARTQRMLDGARIPATDGAFETHEPNRRKD